MTASVTIIVTTDDDGDVQVTRDSHGMTRRRDETDAVHVLAVLESAVEQVRKAYDL